MANLLDIVAGWTAPLPPLTLRMDGLPFNLSGFIVEMVMRRESGALVTLAGTLTPLNQTTDRGKVVYNPGPGDFIMEDYRYTTEQVYTVHFKVTDAFGEAEYFPDGPADTFTIFRD